MMIQATSFIDGQLDHLFGTWRQTDLTENDAVAATNNKFDGTANLIKFDAEICQYFSSNAFALSDQAEQEVFCTDVIVLEALCFLLCEAQDFPGPLSKFIKPISIVHLFVTPLSVAEGGTEPSVMLR